MISLEDWILFFITSFAESVISSVIEIKEGGSEVSNTRFVIVFWWLDFHCLDDVIVGFSFISFVSV